MAEETTTVALVDADIIAYSVGFAAEGEPLTHALHSVKKMIEGITTATRADVVMCFLTGNGNFREEVAVTAEYKGNRTSKKPEHFHQIREYLISRFDAEVVTGMEADDRLGILQHLLLEEEGFHPYICTIDKDLDMIAGMHYNWKKKQKYFIDSFQANKNFYTQLLMGDSTDNIPGIPGVGTKTAEKHIKEALCIAEMDDTDPEEEMYWMCLEKYAEHFDKPFEMMYEQGRLLWIMRTFDDIWEPKF